MISYGATISYLDNAVTSVNENYVDCISDRDYLGVNSCFLILIFFSI